MRGLGVKFFGYDGSVFDGENMIERRQSEVDRKALSVFFNSSGANATHFSDSMQREFLSIDVLPALRR